MCNGGLDGTRGKGSGAEQRHANRVPENGVHFRGHFHIAP
jgi:hypothetical protein